MTENTVFERLGDRLLRRQGGLRREGFERADPYIQSALIENKCSGLLLAVRPRWVALAEAGAGVAKNSYHLSGQAVDVRLSDRTSSQIHRVALDVAAGGVGHYPRSNFVHIDSGPVRTW